jgi:phosphoribosyl 1,2-cyclic phosphodiesterase
VKGFCVLASGSKGNCTYIGSDTTRILIDAGISRKVIEERLNSFDVPLSSIDAVLITHEHTDHIKGLAVLCQKYQIPVLCNSETARAIVETMRTDFSFRIFFTNESFTFGDIEILPFSIPHDAVDPVAFRLELMGKTVGVCTDLGFPTSIVKKQLRESDFLILEANHHVPMVHSSSRPQIYKDRVLGRQGHLSNEQCVELLQSVLHPQLQQVHLAHLSAECNHHDLALLTVSQSIHSMHPNVRVLLTHQDRCGALVDFTQ